VNARVAAAEPVRWQITPLAEARRAGAMMLFGEKYPDPVRMVSMGQFSKELCGGTHLTNTQEVGPFEIITEEGVSAGTRRITALTGNKAAQRVKLTETALAEAAEILGVSTSEVPVAATALVAKARELRKALTGASASGAKLQSAAAKPSGAAPATYEQTKQALAETGRLLAVAPLDVPQRLQALATEVSSLEKQLAARSAAGPLSGDRLLETAEKVDGVTVVVSELPGVEPNLMRQLIDQVRGKASPAAVLLATRQGDDKVTLVAGISKDLQSRKLSAGEWIRPVAAAVGGGGGGRPDLAQAGGKNPANLPEALQIAKSTIREMIAG
jgi:alanyl-tRNA synthetase